MMQGKCVMCVETADLRLHELTVRLLYISTNNINQIYRMLSAKRGLITVINIQALSLRHKIVDLL